VAGLTGLSRFLMPGTPAGTTPADFRGVAVSREDDKVFIRNFMGVIGLLFAVTIILIAIASFLYSGYPGAQEQLAKKRATEHLQPVGEVHVTGQAMPKIAQASSDNGGGGGEPRSGKEVAEQVCLACHANNFMNSPQVGNKDEWAPRLKAAGSVDKLVGYVKNGYKNMPPQGGSASDEEIRRALKYMVVDKTGLDLPK